MKKTLTRTTTAENTAQRPGVGSVAIVHPQAGRLSQLAAAANSNPSLQRIASLPVIQRSVNTAAAALRALGIITVKRSHLSGRFRRTHAVAYSDIAAIQARVTELREEEGPREIAEVLDMTDSDNWPTAGGMIEGDAKTVAESLGWDDAGSGWSCSDRSHTPNGKVYTNGSGQYYGADNTGHVGWGFKVWEIKQGKTFDYKGNITWDGDDWNHHDRGT